MKIRTQILTAAIATSLGILNGVSAYASEPLTLYDTVPGELKVDRISPGQNEVTVTYYDTGTDVDRPIRMNIQYPNNGSEPDENTLEMAVPIWMTQLYDKASGRAGAVSLVSGVPETVTSAMMASGTSLLNNESGLLYLALATTPGDGSIRTINIKVDYRQCMSYYQDGVECLARDTDEGRVYEPWLDGVRLAEITVPAPVVEPEPEPEPESVEPEPVEPEPTVSGSEPVESESTMSVPTVSGATQRVDLAVATNYGAATTNEPVMSEVRIMPEVEYQGESQDVAVVSTTGIGVAATSNEKKSKKKVQEQDTKTEVEVPELGGEAKKWHFSLWLTIPFIVAGIGVGLWWFLPVVKKRKKKEE